VARINVKVIGIGKAQAALSLFSSNVEKDVKQVVAESAFAIDRWAKESISAEKHGKLYKRIYLGGQRIKNQRASAPGEAPATLTGRLKTSIHPSFSVDEFTAEIGSSLKYSSYLEHGTSKMAARPWLLPVFEEIRPEFIRQVREVVRQNSRR